MTKRKICFPFVMKTTPKKPKPGRPQTSEIVRSLKDAAALLDCSTRSLQNYRKIGCPGFGSDGTVDMALVRPWVQYRIASRRGSPEARQEKLREEIRKLKFGNDAAGRRLVGRAWLVSRMQRVLGEMHALRAKSEAEHPLRFATAKGDVAACRSVVRGIWSEIFRDLQGLAKHFEEGR